MQAPRYSITLVEFGAWPQRVTMIAVLNAKGT